MTIDTTQAILVEFPEREPGQGVQRLALFDEKTGEPYPFVGEPWIDIPDEEMQNGWHHLDNNPPPQYRKRPNGHVELRGVVAGGSLGTIFNLPEKYRHHYTGALHFPVIGNRGIAHFYVHPNGDIVAQNFFGIDPAEDNWYGLAPIIYSAT